MLYHTDFDLHKKNAKKPHQFFTWKHRNEIDPEVFLMVNVPYPVFLIPKTND